MQAILNLLSQLAAPLKEVFSFFNGILLRLWPTKTPEQKSEEKQEDRSTELDKDVQDAQNRANHK